MGWVVLFVAEIVAIRWGLRHLGALVLGALLLVLLAVVITEVVLSAQSCGLWPPTPK